MTPNRPNATEDPIREHSFDGIQEYDKRLPNWWLWTLYGAIVFSFGYWIAGHNFGLVADPGGDLDRQLAEARAAASRSGGTITNESLWALSKNSDAVKAGEQIYLTNCAVCHRPDLQGQIGPNLADTAWIHGGQPLEAMKIVNEGVLAKGMPPWAPVLGPQKVKEALAFIYSRHKEGESVTQAPPWVPVAPPVPPPAP